MAFNDIIYDLQISFTRKLKGSNCLELRDNYSSMNKT